MNLAYKGITINYEISGTGIPLVFLHGFLENSTMWNDISPYFVKDHTCIAIDLLGHGQTGCLGYIHTMEDMAIALQAVLDTLGVQNCTVLGHSMGGYVMLALLDLFPHMIHKLVLLNSTSFEDSQEKKLNRERAIAIVKENPNIYTATVIANLFAEENRSKFSSEIKKINEQASLTSLQGIIAALEGMKIRKDRRNILRNFDGRKTVFAGKDDPVLSYDQTTIESNCCDLDLVSFNGGHMTYLENRKQFIAALRSFTQKNSLL